MNGLRLRMREEVDFDAGIIISYGYEVYRGEERLYWYDDFPHPSDNAKIRFRTVINCRELSFAPPVTAHPRFARNSQASCERSICGRRRG